MSLRARILNTLLRRIERPALARMPAHPPKKIRDRFDMQARLFFRPPRGTRVEQTSVAGLSALEVGPADAVPILYLHGGAYVFGSPKTHKGLMGRLVARCDARAVLPDYPLAPEHPFPAAPEAALAVYREMAAKGPVVLGGDSAGGGLALALLAWICNEGLPQPLMTFVLSPWTDLTLSGDSMTANARSEVLLPPGRMSEARDAYMGEADPADPRASPLFADFTGASAVHLWVGDTEILRDDARRMANHLRGQGVDATLIEESDLPHVWPLFPAWQLPETEATLDQIARAVQTSLDRANR
ncbi:alpha/beta hydrolase [Salibaculum sp.]|uniref:alpha/beta hydrolase n=1 Tax=Salibaculum sp. TaxID=2855480 RepID=UPI002B464FF9|nr:alpha/beta hydrolase [Salibaculum sp.]HKL68213.1 alpha/beta hydrolase [Salibaculum sp.]